MRCTSRSSQPRCHIACSSREKRERKKGEKKEEEKKKDKIHGNKSQSNTFLTPKLMPEILDRHYSDFPLVDKLVKPHMWSAVNTVLGAER